MGESAHPGSEYDKVSSGGVPDLASVWDDSYNDNIKIIKICLTKPEKVIVYKSTLWRSGDTDVSAGKEVAACTN